VTLKEAVNRASISADLLADRIRHFVSIIA
jgi:hypothetical protein